MDKLIAIVGPTGSGKTALAVKLAHKFNGIIISADSRQIYRGLDIGTNKEGVTGSWEGMPARITGDIPQLVIDIVDPGGRYTLNDWLEEARHAMRHIFEAGKLPVIVGGTGLYVTALLEGYQPGGGRGAKNNTPVGFESLILMPEVDREVLFKKSDARFPLIFDRLVTETEKLHAAGATYEWLDNIGLDYRYAVYLVRKQLSREKAIEQYQAASRAYIRRQLTWWRHHGKPIAVKTAQQAETLVNKFLSP